MDNSVFFDIGLNWSSVKSGLTSMAGSAKSIFGGIDSTISKTQGYLNKLGGTTKINLDTSGIDTAGKKIEELGRKIRKIGDDGGSGNGGGEGFFGRYAKGAFWGNMGARAATLAIDKTMEMGKSMLESGINVQNMKVGLSTFVGDKKADFIVEDIMKSSAKTPYTTQALLPGVRGLMATGYDYERSKRDMWGLANAIAATGGTNDNLARTAMEMQHAAASGKVQGNVLREFMNNGLPIFPLLTNSLPSLKGMSPAKAKEKLEDEGITYNQLTDAFDRASKSGGMFAGAMDKLSQTIGGKWSTIMDYWQMGGAKLVLSQNNAITNIEDRIINGLKGFPEMIERWTPTVDLLFKKFDEIYPSIQKFGQGVVDVLKPIGEFAVSKEVTDFIKAVGDLGNATGKTVKWILDHGPKQIAETAVGFTASVMQGAIGSWNYIVDRDQYDRDYDPNVKTSQKTMYGWGTLPVGAKRGVDSVAMKGIADSIGADNILKDQKEFEDYLKYVAPYKFPKTTFEYQQLPLPELPEEKKKKKQNNAAADLESDSDKVVGGGRKQIIINVNRGFVEKLEMHVKDMKEGVAQTESTLGEMFLRILNSANAAI